MPGFDLKVNGEYARLDSLLCPSCRFILKDAIQTEEGIRFCKSCCEEIQNSPSNTCPVSGTRIGKNEEIHPDIAVRREVERLPVKCMNSEEGCPWVGKLKDHETTHKLECLYVTEPCPMGCGKKLSKNDIQAHLDTKCPLRKVNCQFCRETFTARDYDVILICSFEPHSI
jgi:phage FluMu protein Com